MVLAKIVPVVPGHFTRYEWIALALWGGLGFAVGGSRQRGERAKQELRVAEISGEGTIFRPER